MQSSLLLLLAALATAAFASPMPRFRPAMHTTPGRVLTKTFTYDSTKDTGDPCNPVNGDPQKCLKSMEEMTLPYHPAMAQSDFVESEMAVAQHAAEASDSDFDYIYQRPTKNPQSAY